MRGPDHELLHSNPSSEREWKDATGRTWSLRLGMSKPLEPRRIKSLLGREGVRVALFGDDGDRVGWVHDPTEKRALWDDIYPRILGGEYTARITEWRAQDTKTPLLMIEQFCS